ncbi:MAG: type IVB secretion system lipoprotein DotD [Legionellales bacterium]
MNKKIVMMFVILAITTGCTTTFRKPPVNNPSDDATIKLAEAAVSVSDSMVQMARVQKVVTPPHEDNTLTIPNAYNMQARASVDWSGPIEELTDRIARASHFKLRILGLAPSVPILISMNVKDQSLAEILRDIDYQAGRKANIHVYPNSQVVELRYAKIYS